MRTNDATKYEHECKHATKHDGSATNDGTANDGTTDDKSVNGSANEWNDNAANYCWTDSHRQQHWNPSNWYLTPLLQRRFVQLQTSSIQELLRMLRILHVLVGRMRSGVLLLLRMRQTRLLHCLLCRSSDAMHHHFHLRMDRRLHRRLQDDGMLLMK